MDKDYSELSEYLDQKFVAINVRLSDINAWFLDVDEKLDLKADKSDINNLLSAVDAYAVKADTYFKEIVMPANKDDRLGK